MAKRKGKSRQRIRDWGQRLAGGDDVEDRAPVRQRLTQRSVKLPPERVESPEDNPERLPKREGMVLGQFPGGVMVRAAGEELLCGIAKTFRAPRGSTALTVGDLVTVAMTRPEHAGEQLAADRDRADGFVLSRQPRTSALARPAPRSGKRRDPYETESFDKILVANMDVLLIVAATREPPLSHGRIDRFLIIAERGELAPVLVINKIDLGPPDEQVLSDFAELGIDLFLCSAVNGQGVPELAASLTGKRSVLAGASGVGKSTLINAIVPLADAATRPVNVKSQRGRHTTSAANLYELPGGGLIVDTPGIRELGIHLDPAELPWYFPEFEQIAPHCKFRNCTHTHEPACAVLAAVEAGQLLPRRYQGYLRILETIGDA
ncbi:MAG TPA: ribosome small subunit-dependent GTPase A [Phycisphaerae bacterium]|nr:ribosome small subunit-dependent GTPase A [Phycisphaerae bacterium]